MCLAQLDHVRVALAGEVNDQQHGPLVSEVKSDRCTICASRRGTGSHWLRPYRTVGTFEDRIRVPATESVGNSSPAAPWLIVAGFRSRVVPNDELPEVELQHPRIRVCAVAATGTNPPCGPLQAVQLGQQPRVGTAVTDHAAMPLELLGVDRRAAEADPHRRIEIRKHHLDRSGSLTRLGSKPRHPPSPTTH
jgi:hypothetical protein